MRQSTSSLPHSTIWRQAQFAGVARAGRTHLTDPLPVTRGQEFRGSCPQVELESFRARELAHCSPGIVTPPNRYIGYEAAAAVVKQVVKDRRSSREVTIKQGHVEVGTFHRRTARRGPRRAVGDTSAQGSLGLIGAGGLAVAHVEARSHVMLLEEVMFWTRRERT